MNIMQKLFGGNPAAPVQPTQTPPGNIPAPQVQTAQTPGTEPNGLVPVTPEPTEQKPLEPFKDIWDTAPVDPNAPAAPEPLVTSENLTKAMANKDFTNSIDPATLAAITAGGDEATAALPSILNAVAQQVMVQSTLVNNKLTEKAVADATKAAQDSIPELVRMQNAANHITESNPIFKDPALKPLIDAAQTQLLSKHPHATPAELTVLTTDFMSAIQESLAPPAPIDPAKAKETDWSKFA